VERAIQGSLEQGLITKPIALENPDYTEHLADGGFATETQRKRRQDQIISLRSP